jgi:hypothetical protein
VRWENVALLLLVVVAVAGVAISGALAGRGASPLPDDVGVRGQSSPPDETPRPHERETQKKTGTMKKRRPRMHDRIRHHAPTRDPHTPMKPTPLPPPAPPPPAGSEFAPG